MARGSQGKLKINPMSVQESMSEERKTEGNPNEFSFIKAAIIQSDHEEEFDVAEQVLKTHNICCRRVGLKKLRRMQLSPSTIVIGDHDFMSVAFQKYKLNASLVDCYPTILRKYLQRPVYESSIKEILEQEISTPIFIKPKTKAKLFSGRPIRQHSDLTFLSNFSKHTKIYVSPIVEFLSEDRVFVLRGKILDIQPYQCQCHEANHPHATVDAPTVEEAVKKFQDSGAPIAYALDFGVLKENKKTVLVEFNDAFALGMYGLKDVQYVSMLVARWNELHKSSSKSAEYVKIAECSVTYT